ncbi:MAG: tRNA adenosine(34) deaminase TadA [Pseudomonadales bacterium]|nr:tRNA adenosine(34) deaminase TadA [Pseudomonadales bacterium]
MTKLSADTLERDAYWMRQALEQADLAAADNEVPVGAVMVLHDELLAVGRNQMITLNDPSAHAEIQCLRAAAAKLDNYRLLDTTLYVSLEPCAMCAGAIVHARVARLVYAATEPKAGAVKSQMRFFEQDFLNHQVDVAEPVLADCAGEKLSRFFRQRRALKKSKL